MQRDGAICVMDRIKVEAQVCMVGASLQSLSDDEMYKSARLWANTG